MTLIIRCVDVSTSPTQIKEFFVEFLKVYDTTSQILFEELQNVLETLGLDINNVRGQGYDNESNIKVLQRIYTVFSHLTKFWKVLRDNVKDVREALLQLAEQDNNSKIKSEVESLATHGIYLKKYRESEFINVKVSTEKIKNEMEMECEFIQKRQIRIKQHYDENSSQPTQLNLESAEESFRNHYFCVSIERFGSLSDRDLKEKSSDQEEEEKKEEEDVSL
ncbi:uncharacterized protein LOC127093873 [Lathyrus oleraceus]|uniref:uncharacterized protein LOC127093873 n=1 Tax=Pisum sativum TaxID=3888 RepID=UPI0021D01426|nr:uncharacterized protein LOC127093873 [Pisum sativum]